MTILAASPFCCLVALAWAAPRGRASNRLAIGFSLGLVSLAVAVGWIAGVFWLVASGAPALLIYSI